MKRLPLIPTILVLGAVAVMIGLGVWQIQRAQWKHALLSRYAAAAQDDTPVAWPLSPDQFEPAYYRRSAFTCAEVTGRDAIAGRNADNASGWVQIARCRTDEGNEAAVQLGWTQNPQPVDWAGGDVTGRITRYGEGVRLVADPPLAGLAPNAPPDPRELPDNHMAYAFQWFFFAITALVIYFLALRRMRGKSGQ
ncbi:SURF1 family protein [Croceicoccus sp. Ery5]|uniref:SURF1 family protein n=1 Tax=Croceicoccus sp. Ery5 TaxID=1703340 RepID=UPI001E2B1158|nr:SURF1 family protein [Croceicoccus sp. Ery5]